MRAREDQGLSLAGPSFPSCLAGKQEEVLALPKTHVLVLAWVRETQLLT